MDESQIRAILTDALSGAFGSLVDGDTNEATIDKFTDCLENALLEEPLGELDMYGHSKCAKCRGFLLKSATACLLCGTMIAVDKPAALGAIYKLHSKSNLSNGSCQNILRLSSNVSYLSFYLYLTTLMVLFLLTCYLFFYFSPVCKGLLSRLTPEVSVVQDLKLPADMEIPSSDEEEEASTGEAADKMLGAPPSSLGRSSFASIASIEDTGGLKTTPHARGEASSYS